MNPIAKQIKELRLQQKLSEKELAKKCGVAPSYIMDIESGKKVINEINAEKILSVLGQKYGFNFDDEVTEEPQRKPIVEKKKEVVKEAYVPIDPVGQWSDALANLIKKYPIVELGTDKVVGNKELPIVGKKVDGYGLDKLMFVKMTDNALEGYRLKKNDVVTILLSKEFFNKGLYLFEYKGKKHIRHLQRESNAKFQLSKGVTGETLESINAAEVKLIGKCIKVEFEVSID